MKKLITLVLAAAMLTSCTLQSMTPTSESYMAEDIQMLSYNDYLPSDTTDEEKFALSLDVGLDKLTEKEFELYFESVRALTEFHNDYYADAGTDGVVAAVKVNYVYTAAEMKRVFDLVCMNRPEFFWLAKNYTYSTRSTYTTMNYYAVSEYADGEVRNDDKNSLDAHVANCIRLLAGERDEYSMIKVVHDYICDTTKYAYDENGKLVKVEYNYSAVAGVSSACLAANSSFILARVFLSKL